MKVRNGFVSNSSSSSFLLISKMPLTEDFITKEYADKGPFALPTVQFLSWNGDDPRYPEELSKDVQDKIEKGYYVREYEITNQGEGPVSAALYYHGYSHLKTENIEVVHGTIEG